MTLAEWIARDAISFSVDSPESFNAAVDQLATSLGSSVELLGFGEALHGGEAILMLRNQLFQRLAEAHGFSAIAIESTFPEGRLANDYVTGRGQATYEEMQDSGFSHGFGRLDANRELVEWMRSYNAASPPTELRFYGIDIPTGPGLSWIAGPRHAFDLVLDYLTSVDREVGQAFRDRIEPLLGADADWERPEAISDPTKAIGLTPAATALRIETEDLITELRARRPELIAKSDAVRYWDASQDALVAREQLNFHAALARLSGGSRADRTLCIRDALMADNLRHIARRERGRGKVLVFAHNGHLRRGQAVASWYTFWPAGSHLNEIFGSRYAVIGSALGSSDANGIGPPEAGTLEARLLSALRGRAAFVPTHRGRGLSASEIAAIPTRSDSTKNLSYSPLDAQRLTDFDWLAFVDSTSYTRGGPPLP